MGKKQCRQLKFTQHYLKDTTKKRPYLKKLEPFYEKILDNPIKTKKQENGRISYWGYIETEKKHLRIILLEDNQTVHTAYFDRNFK